MVATTMAPVVLSSTVYQISGIIDTSMFYRIMSSLDYAAEAAAELFGNYSGQYKMILNIPLGITSSNRHCPDPGSNFSCCCRKEAEGQGKD